MTELKERREIPGKKRRGQAGKSQVDICRKQAEVIKKLKAENELLRIVCGMTAAGRGKLPDEEQLCQAIEDVGGREEYRGCISYLCGAAGISSGTYYRQCRKRQKEENAK